ncbi:MAG: DUF4013 domain-containing protein [Sandaracinaceae bacterium]
MEYLRGWRALRSDPEWKSKVGVATVLLLSSFVIPVLGQLIMGGWLVLALRLAVRGQDAPLPPLRFDIELFKRLLGLGFKPMVAQIVYSLPIMAVGMVMGCASGALNIAIQRGEAGPVVAVVLGVLFLVYVVTIAICVPLAMVAALRASLMDNLGEAMSFRGVRALFRPILGDVIIGTLVMGLVSFPIVMGGMILCYVGVFPAAVIVSVLNTYFHAELYRRYLEKGGEPLPVGSPDASA